MSVPKRGWSKFRTFGLRKEWLYDFLKGNSLSYLGNIQLLALKRCWKLEESLTIKETELR